MKCAIVTGANSFVGSATVKELINNQYHVFAVVHKNDEKIKTLNNVTIIKSDCSEYSNLDKKIKSDLSIEYFYHFAWSGVSGKERSDVAVQLKNIQYTIDALHLAKKMKCKRFIGAGSIMERECISAGLTPGNKPGLGYVYGYAKLAAHLMCSSIAANIGIDLLWPMITNAYGIGEFSSRLINSTICKCIKGEEPEFTEAKQNYDFIYIDDVARGMRLIAENGKPFTEYLIGSSKAKPLKEFLLEMQKTIAPNINFKFGIVPYTGINMPLSSFDCSNTKNDTGFHALIPFSQGCRVTYDWLKNNIQ